jgi:hypothetical protein
VAEMEFRDFERRLESRFTEMQNQLGGLARWKNTLMADDAFGGMNAGIQWVGGTAIKDGAVTAEKLEANLVVGNTFTTSEDPTAARWTLDSTSMRFYRTGGTLVSELKSDGSGFLGSTGGTSATAALAWTTTPSVSMNGTITIGANGKIIDADGSFWDTTGITLVGSAGVGDTITFKAGSATVAQIFTSAGTLSMQATNGTLLYSSLALTTTGANLSNPSASSSLILETDAELYGSDDIQLFASGNNATLDNNGDFFFPRRFYPGTSAGGQQSTAYMHVNVAGQIEFQGNVSFGNSLPYFNPSASGGTGGLDVSTAGNAMPSATKVLSIGLQGTGTVYYIPVYSAFNPWAA